MAYYDKELEVTESTIPDAGKGLFTKTFIQKGNLITEYKGTVTTWKEVKDDATNVYIYYINRNHVIDASNHLKSLGRYANDAQGMKQQTGLLNNARYTYKGGKVYLEAIAAIPAGAEILVSYGKDYWQVIRNNMRLDAKRKNRGM